jgi:hypothetical protein
VMHGHSLVLAETLFRNRELELFEFTLGLETVSRSAEVPRCMLSDAKHFALWVLLPYRRGADAMTYGRIATRQRYGRRDEVRRH